MMSKQQQPGMLPLQLYIGCSGNFVSRGRHSLCETGRRQIVLRGQLGVQELLELNERLSDLLNSTQDDGCVADCSVLDL